jgi:hypothetical protein
VYRYGPVETLFGFFMVLETFLRSPRVHPFYNPTLAEWRSPSRMTRQTSISFKDSLEHPLEDAAWRLPHAARARQITTTNESGALHGHLDLPLTIADYARSACPKASRFPMTLATPLVTSAASASARPSSAQVACSRADDVFVNRQKLREVFSLMNFEEF